jgi:hypothetical protein
MTDISDLTALVTARFVAASATADNFWAAYDRALASFGAAIAGDAIEHCRNSGTPQGEAVVGYISALITAELKAGRLPEIREMTARFLAELGVTPIGSGPPTPPQPRPQLRVIDGGDEP